MSACQPELGIRGERSAARVRGLCISHWYAGGSGSPRKLSRLTQWTVTLMSDATTPDNDRNVFQNRGLVRQSACGYSGSR